MTVRPPIAPVYCRKLPYLALLGLLTALAPTPACAQETETIRGGGGRTPVADQAARTSTEPEAPNYAKRVEGLYARKVFSTMDAERLYAIEVWGLLVSPAIETEPFSFPGAMVLTVRSGTATLVVDEERTKLALGTTVLVAEGDQARIVNDDKERPLSLRATVIRGAE